MSLVETFLYSKSRIFLKILFKKATRQDPIISRIKLLEEFEDAILVIDKIEEFYDVQTKRKSSQVDSFSQTRVPSKYIFEEISFPIVKLPKSLIIEKYDCNSTLTDAEPQDTDLQIKSYSSTSPQDEVHLIVNSRDFGETSSLFPTCVVTNSSTIETYTRNSALTDNIKLQDPELQLKNYPSISPQDEVHVPQNIEQTTSSIIVKLPKSRFPTGVPSAIETRNSYSPRTDTISESQVTEFNKLSNYSSLNSSQNEVFITTVSLLQDFEENSLPIVKLPKSYFTTFAVTNIETDTNNSHLTDTELQLNGSSTLPQNEVGLIHTIDADSKKDIEEIFSTITNSSVIETHANNSFMIDIINESQVTEQQLDSSFNSPQNEIGLINTTTDSKDFEEISSPIVDHTSNSHLTSEPQDVESQLSNSSTSSKSNQDKSDFKNEAQKRCTLMPLSPYLVSLYGDRIHPSYEYYNPVNNYSGYAQYYNNSFDGYYQPQYSNKVEIKKGDWICGKCYQHNFAKRNRCYSCQVDRDNIVIKMKYASS